MTEPFLCPQCKLRPPPGDRLYCVECDDEFERKFIARKPRCPGCKAILTASRKRVSSWCSDCVALGVGSGDKAMAKDFNKRARDRHPSTWIEDEGTPAQRQHAMRWLKDHPKLTERLMQDNSRLRARCSNYGITVAHWLLTAAKQDGQCAICRKGGDDPVALVVDHDHVTGEVRGLLCNDCNFGLGWLRIDGEQSITRAHSVVAYVEAFMASKQRAS